MTPASEFPDWVKGSTIGHLYMLQNTISFVEHSGYMGTARCDGEIEQIEDITYGIKAFDFSAGCASTSGYTYQEKKDAI
jgi:pyridoxal/pyridoxine/pyridoxamine kinase